MVRGNTGDFIDQPLPNFRTWGLPPRLGPRPPTI